MLYPTFALRRGYPEGYFGGDPLSPSSIGLSPLIVGHPSRYTSIGCGPPPTGRSASPCPRIDHIGFGSLCSDWSHFRTTPLAACAVAGFRFRSAFQLTTPRNSLALESRRSIKRCSLPVVPQISLNYFQGDQCFHAISTCRHLVSVSFHSPFGVLFSFPSRY